MALFWGYDLDRDRPAPHGEFMKKVVITLILLAGLASCGKKAPLDVPQPPPGKDTSLRASADGKF